MDLFTEAMSHNTYFNRKVSIDVNGFIKNCSSNLKSFGNVKKEKIHDIITKKNFQKLWNSKKDQTEVCMDCEFRYMCVDSRTPVQTKNGKWIHKIECKYNPYIAKWEGEEGYKSLNLIKKR
jgi:radical SAM protein with 4Fe4S-binding SPASM domain